MENSTMNVQAKKKPKSKKIVEVESSIENDIPVNEVVSDTAGKITTAERIKFRVGRLTLWLRSLGM